jgi:hypothetical protein
MALGQCVSCLGLFSNRCAALLDTLTQHLQSCAQGPVSRPFGLVFRATHSGLRMIAQCYASQTACICRK